MKATALFLLVLSALTVAAQADGIMMPSQTTWLRNREKAMINEPEQKAAVLYSKGKEQLIISPSYEGRSDSFAWVVPVPARPKVEIVKGALFHELMTLVSPKPDVMADGGRAAGKAAGPPVTVLERKTVGAYDVSVLAATDGKALLKWLAKNKYHLPPKALGPVNAYVKEKWTFVACRIKAPKAAKGLASGTLAPLRLTFAAKRPVYPIRLSAANPKPFKLVLYLVVAASAFPGSSRVVEMVSAPTTRDPKLPPETDLAVTLPAGQKDYPTLAKLTREKSHVYTVRLFQPALEPSGCTRDFVWRMP